MTVGLSIEKRMIDGKAGLVCVSRYSWELGFSVCTVSCMKDIHSDVCCQATLAKRRGIRLIVVGMTTLSNVTEQLTDIASSPLDFYRVDNLRNHGALAEQIAGDICGTLRQFKSCIIPINKSIFIIYHI